MKGLIMAGGEGTRLRPITCDKPKPMVEIMDKPVIQYIIELLKKHRIRDIAVTLQYMPHAIMDFLGSGEIFGTSLQYFIETAPLGTAGSVKNAESFLDEEFIIISGDCMTDIDLKSAMEFHKSKKSMVTIVLKEVEIPLEYGVVITNDDGQIKKFLEKPSWEETFSNLANTGIYIVHPSILNHIPENQFFDFSKDLFPKLMDMGIPMYGYTSKRYWCDIGDIESYIRCHSDILEKKVNVKLDATNIGDNIYVGENVQIDPKAIVVSPVYIGKNVTIGEGATLFPNSVISRNCNIGKSVTVKNAVIGQNCFIKDKSQLRGCILCGNSVIKNHVSIYEHAVVGVNTQIDSMCEIKPNVKIWPHKHLEESTILNNNLIWSKSFSKKIFTENGISREINIDLTPEYASKLGAVFGSTLNGKGVGIAYGTSTPVTMIKDSLISGIQSTGCQVYDMSQQILPNFRRALRHYNILGGVYLNIADNMINVQLFAEDGLNITRSQERQLENLFARDSLYRATPENIKTRINMNLDKLKFIPINHEINEQLKHQELDFEIETCDSLIQELINEYFEIPQLTSNRKLSRVIINDTGENIEIIDNKNQKVPDYKLQTLLYKLVLELSNSDFIVIPVSAPELITKMAKDFGKKIIECKSNSADIMKILRDNELNYQFDIMFNGLFAISQIIKYICNNGQSLSEVLAQLPQFIVQEREIKCDIEKKSYILRRLAHEIPDSSSTIREGLKICDDRGRVLIVPHQIKSAYRIIAESFSQKYVEELLDYYSQKIDHIIHREEIKV